MLRRMGDAPSLRRRLAGAGLLAAALLAPLAAHGADPVPAGLRVSLLLLDGEGCRVRYSPGTLDRAAHVQDWVCELTAGGARLGGQSPLEVLVLDREDWQRAQLACAYGLPCATAGGAVALPAAGDASTVELWTAALGELPAVGGTPMLGTPEEAASLMPADALAIPMVARQQVTAAGFAAEEPWVLELLAHLLAVDAARKSERGAGIAAFWARVRRRAGEQSPPVGELAVEMARQARLFAAAEALAGSSRRLPARELRKLQARGGGQLRPADLQAEWPHAFRVLP